MRKIISIPLFLALFCTNIVLAQKQTTQEKELLKVYNKSELNNFKKDNELQLLILQRQVQLQDDLR